MSGTLYHIILLYILGRVHVAFSQLTESDKTEFKTVPWINWPQALAAYKAENLAAELLGKNTIENPNRLKFYPENRVLKGRPVIVFCLLTPDKSLGYRTNSITLRILQEGFSHSRSLLAPKRRLLSHAEQLNCWNFAQESVCQPLRDCGQQSKPELRTVGIITKEGWGVFQLQASRVTQAHYQCLSETQSVLSSQEMNEKNLTEYVTVGSSVERLQVYEADVGEPQLTLAPSYPRGEPLSARCNVTNSVPGSEFGIRLILLRPPPAGTPGSDLHELLASHSVGPAETLGVLDWRGELALLSHHGLSIHCSVDKDWGDRKGLRLARGNLHVRYMFPAYLHNPRIQQEMAHIRIMSFQNNYYKSPPRISLRKAEYAVCKADGFPNPLLKWSVTKADSVWILNETMFISARARVGQTFTAVCEASSSVLNLTDSVEVQVTVMSSGQSLLPSFSLVTIALLHALPLWHSLQTCRTECFGL